jgi:excisionase family DNA binding protein
MSENPPKEHEGWSIKAFCEQFCVSRSHVYREFKAQKLKKVKVGRRTLIPNESVQTWWQNIQKVD